MAYVENAVVYMMTCKSVQRAFRRHLLVRKCLYQMIVKSVVKVEETEKMFSYLLKDDTTLNPFMGEVITNRLD